jgi:hypothetical protein
MKAALTVLAVNVLFVLLSKGFSASLDYSFAMEPWLRDPPAITYSKVAARSRVLIFVITTPNERQVIAQDEQKRQWLLTSGKPMERHFTYSQVIALETTACEDGFIYFMIVPPIGYKRFILLNRVDSLD